MRRPAVEKPWKQIPDFFLKKGLAIGILRKVQDVRTAIAKRNPNRMMQFRATRRVRVLGDLGSSRSDRPQTTRADWCEVAYSLSQPGQKIDAIPFQSLARQFPLQGSVDTKGTRGAYAIGFAGASCRDCTTDAQLRAVHFEIELFVR
jgi:hypothetical protein